MKRVITYGTFDLFHYGHQALLERAKQLGDYLIVGVTSDLFDKSRGKINVHQPLIERLHAIEATGLADQIVVEEYKGQKIDDIIKYNVDIFAIGSDWEGKFDYLKEYCEVVYLPRTPGVSSTELRRSSSKQLRLCCVGGDYFADRIVQETSYVGGIDVTCVADINNGKLCPSANPGGYDTCDSFKEMTQHVDAVYISASMKHRSSLIRDALDEGLHVLFEGPIAQDCETARELQDVAHERNLVLMEATAVQYLPAFQHLSVMLKSGVIGEIKDIDASYSIIPEQLDYSDKYASGCYTMSSRGLLPAFAFLGTDIQDVDIVCGYNGDFCNWSKFNLLYSHASASIKIGRGVKTEGDMVITGTSGYIYVPAPWWLLEYFEIRGEDLRDTKKHYFECVGPGQRYMIKQFCEYCSNYQNYIADKPAIDSIENTTVSLVEKIVKGQCKKLENHSERFGGGENVGSVQA